jgi:hypothetical protein
LGDPAFCVPAASPSNPLLYLTGAGYKVRLLQAPPANGSLFEALREIDAVLLGSSLADGLREGFLKAMTGALETATIPVLALSAWPKGVANQRQVGAQGCRQGSS